ncbi:MAG: hypothetical protein IJR93_12295 [Treponema sp.]|nr:hypothetical protein [Treponema sp.]
MMEKKYESGMIVEKKDGKYEIPENLEFSEKYEDGIVSIHVVNKKTKAVIDFKYSLPYANWETDETEKQAWDVVFDFIKYQKLA